MKSFFSCLTIFIITCYQFGFIQLKPQTTMPEDDPTYGMIKEGVERGSYGPYEDDSFLGLFTTTVKCIFRPRELICGATDGNMNGCMRPLQLIFDKANGTKIEGLAKLIIKTIVASKDFVCTAKFQDVMSLLSAMLSVP